MRLNLLVVMFALLVNYALLRMKERTMRRKKLSGRGSRALFTATASKTHFRNVQTRPQRGGIRL